MADNDLETIGHVWLPQATITLDLKGKLLVCNSSMCAILNRVRQGSIQKSQSYRWTCIFPNQLAGRDFFELQQGDIIGCDTMCKMPFAITHSNCLL